MRYAWDFYHQYLEEANLKRGLKSLYAKYVLHKIRTWDVINNNRVDHFISNSEYISKRIKKVYNRNSKVIYPPVNIDEFPLKKDKDDFYFTASRLVSYKKIDLIVQAFNEMPNKKLVVAGNGPDFNKIKKIAKSNIELKGFVENKELINLMQNAKAFVFAAEEDFGIMPVEAQSCGTPVIGFNKGGLKETVIDKRTGVLFKNQQVKDIIESIRQFEKLNFDPNFIRNHASKFSKKRFEEEMKEFVEEKYNSFRQSL